MQLCCLFSYVVALFATDLCYMLLVVGVGWFVCLLFVVFVIFDGGYRLFMFVLLNINSSTLDCGILSCLCWRRGCLQLLWVIWVTSLWCLL